MTQKILDRFSSLIEEGDSIYQKSEVAGSGYNPELHSAFIEWQMKSKNILSITCGEKSHYLSQFETNLKAGMGDTRKSILNRVIPILRAAEDDLKNGFLITIKKLIQSEVFDSELDQAQHFLDSGYKVASAVTAGVVLETAIKELAKNNGIDIYQEGTTKPKKLDALNSELKNSSVYSTLQHKQILTLAHIRNKAAHGEVEEFNENDVQNMIRDIERFLLEYVS
ncbi:DUF4145 domain-containing protein [Acinetobacter baumannii]|nr:DUF4145 domain-containing protein [Acinetobacter baumannii]